MPPPDEPVDDGGPRLPPPPPVPRLRSAVVTMLMVVLSAGLLLGAQVDRPGFAVVCLGVQVWFVAAWAYGSRPPGPWVVALVGVAGALAADGLAVYAPQASLQPLGYVVVGALLLGVVGQIARGVGRARVTESLGATITVVVAAVGLATPVLLTRHPGGREALAACLLATGTAVTVARLADLVLPWPRITPQVPRGAIGIVAGTMAGTGVAAWAGWLLMGVSTGMAALGGLLVALLALLSDLGMGYAETGRRLAGEPVDGPRSWARLALGPLVALAVAAPATYLLSVLLLVRGL